jgi:23S rRNA maturation mini-RNase III
MLHHLLPQTECIDNLDNYQPSIHKFGIKEISKKSQNKLESQMHIQLIKLNEQDMQIYPRFAKNSQENDNPKIITFSGYF